MAVLHNKEEKIQVVIGRLPKKYTDEQFTAMFIKLYSKDWGKIKAAYIRQSQDKEPGTVINMPKPDLYLKQLLATYLQQRTSIETKPEVVIAEVAAPAEAKPAKVVAKQVKTPVEAKPVKPATKKVKTPIEVKPEKTVKEKPKTTKKPKSVD